jgi:hypothetical protein
MPCGSDDGWEARRLLPPLDTARPNKFPKSSTTYQLKQRVRFAASGSSAASPAHERGKDTRPGFD